MIGRLLRLLLVVAIVGYLGLMAMALLSNGIIFQPHPARYRLSSVPADIRPLTFDSRGAKLAAFYLPNPAARYTLLFSHGNGEDLGDNIAFFRELHRAGFAVFAWDYRGYGASEGAPSERSFYEDSQAAYRYLTGTLQVPPEWIVAHGRSLGSAAAIDLAATQPVSGLIAEAPFLSAFRVLTRVRLLPWDKFDNSGRIGRVRCPVLIIHGRADEVIPWWHGERLYQLAREPKRALWIDGAGHNDVLLVAPQAYFAALQDFSKWLESRQQARAGK